MLLLFWRQAVPITSAGAVTIGSPTLAGTGASTAPGIIAASGGVAIGHPVLAGVGTVTAAPGVTGTGGVTLGHPVLAGVGGPLVASDAAATGAVAVFSVTGAGSTFVDRMAGVLVPEQTACAVRFETTVAQSAGPEVTAGRVLVAV